MAGVKISQLLILGIGSTGCDVAHWALNHPEHVSHITIVGGRSSQPTEQTRELERCGVECVYGTEDISGHYDVCVASPGISEFSSFYQAARHASSEIMSEPEFAWRLSQRPWCTITGTNGKTTTTSLVHSLLEISGISSCAVGNIGTTAISSLDAFDESTWMVAELSSYQLAGTRHLHPRVAILLNITPDHLSWHRTYENYAQAKLKMFANMGVHDTAIVDYEDAGILEAFDQISQAPCRVVRVGLSDHGGDHAAFVDQGVLVIRLDGKQSELVAVSELALSGNHNVINMLAAAAAALSCGAEIQAVREGLQAFQPLEHRIEPCGTIDGVRYINDSKATNVDATIKALGSFPNQGLIVLLGGHDKNTPLDDLATAVHKHARCAICFGEAGERIATALKDATPHEAQIKRACHLRDALRSAYKIAQPGEVVLLSPACSSFDEFSCFEERGRTFKTLVHALQTRPEVG